MPYVIFVSNIVKELQNFFFRVLLLFLSFFFSFSGFSSHNDATLFIYLFIYFIMSRFLSPLSCSHGFRWKVETPPSPPSDPKRKKKEQGASIVVLLPRLPKVYSYFSFFFVIIFFQLE